MSRLHSSSIIARAMVLFVIAALFVTSWRSPGQPADQCQRRCRSGDDSSAISRSPRSHFLFFLLRCPLELWGKEFLSRYFPVNGVVAAGAPNQIDICG